VLSLDVDGVQVGFFGLALLHEGFVLSFHVGILRLGVDFHNLHLLLGVDDQFLGRSFGVVEAVNGVGFDLVDDDSLVSLGPGDQYRGFFLGFDSLDILFGLSLDDGLFHVNLGSGNVLGQLVHFSFVLPLQVGKVLLLLIFLLQAFVFLFFFVILEFKLDVSLVSQGLHEVRVDDDFLDIALLEHNSVPTELSVKLLHHRVGHV